jgi:hypothetical protein
MKFKTLLTVSLGLIASEVSADVRTFLGSSRWNTTIFRSGVKPALAKTSNTTFYLVEYGNGQVINQVKIDAWIGKNPNNGRTERMYLVDEDFSIEYAFFGLGGTSPAGGMQFGGVEAISPFRGTLSYGDLGAFALYPSADYYAFSDNSRPALDVIEITGSARLNTAFSGPGLLTNYVQLVENYLVNRGYFEVR